MENYVDKEALNIFKKIKMEYAIQDVSSDEKSALIGPNLKSALFLEKGTQKYILRFSAETNWLYQNKKLVPCNQKQRKRFFDVTFREITPLVLVEETKMPLKVIFDSRILSSGLVLIALQNGREGIAISPSNLLLFLKYIKRPVILTEI
ncbi:hypothetical protein [Liquorilactobacillus oeni]|uniref:Uncharacterized protein n=1 Tax=Liquorilactobacillus oeni DSM 19972 TaxID=1423777 RepID=A0A0R1MCN3_9LACO|nr:hypothetical protein [Liquorilactobacillus oeni]KRL05854.1 hypothetical protein FD46_GL000613 [Liquorilactobacillus oeni DSM 19972]